MDNNFKLSRMGININMLLNMGHALTWMCGLQSGKSVCEYSMMNCLVPDPNDSL